MRRYASLMLVPSERRFSTRAQFIIEEQLRVSALRPTLAGECLDGRGFRTCEHRLGTCRFLAFAGSLKGKRSWPSSKSQTWVSTGASSSKWTTQSWTEGVGRGGSLKRRVVSEKVGNEGEVENNIFGRGIRVDWGVFERSMPSLWVQVFGCLV